MDSSVTKRRGLAWAGLLLALTTVSVLGWWLVGPSLTAQPGLHVALDQLPDTLNPVLRQNSTALAVNDLLWNALFTKSRPDLAEGLAMVDGDNTRWRVTLKQVTWQDGRSFDAADVEFTLAAYLNPANNSPMREYLDNALASLKVVGERELEFVFRQPIPDFRVAAFLNFPIVPAKLEGKALSTNLLAGERERTLGTRPIGTGPFQLKVWEIGRSLQFTANPSYFGMVPGLPALTLHQVFDPVQRRKGWEEGKYQLVPLLDPLDLNSQTSEVVRWASRSFYRIEFNTKHPSLAEAAVRARLAQNLDAAGLLKALNLEFPVNRGVYPTEFFSTTLKDYGVPPIVANLVPNSSVPPPRLVLLVSEDQRSFGERVAAQVAAQWKTLGTKVEVKVLRQDNLEQVMNRGDYEVALVEAKGFDSLYSDLAEIYSSSGRLNRCGLADPTLDRLLATANREIDMNRWYPAAIGLQKRLDQLVPSAWLFSAPSGALVKNLAGFNPVGDRIFLGAEAWRGGTQ